MRRRLLRFADLKAANIVTNWPQLKRLVDLYGFPAGFLISPGRRMWEASDVEEWLQHRKTNHVHQKVEYDMSLLDHDFDEVSAEVLGRL